MVAMVDNLIDRLKQSAASDHVSEDTDQEPEDFDLEVERSDTRQPLPITGLDLPGWRDRLVEHDSKWERLKETLEEVSRDEPAAKVIVYSYFKRTLAYLQQRLTRTGLRSVLISGDVPSRPEDPDRDERGKRFRAFREDPSIRVLLATEVGDEGLDLQFCHTLINYDLPWNPMRVEQRIGRVDRIGQRSPFITVINLSMPGTIEDDVLQRLYLRIGIFEQSIGDLEPILGEEIKRLTAELFSKDLSPDEQEYLIEQTADVIERRRQEQERWEDETAPLIGHDEFFLEEVDRARQRHRYVGGDELFIYLRDFLAANYRSCTLSRVEGSRRHILRVNDELREFLRQSIPATDPLLREFLRRSDRGDVPITTDQDEAEAASDVEFLTFYHPLIRAVSSYYEEHASQLHPVSYTRVRLDAVPAGAYAWFLYVIEITGARPLKDHELVALRIPDGPALSSDDSEALLAEMLVSAESMPPPLRHHRVERDVPAYADDILATRLEHWFRERQRLNDALVAHRLASLEQTFKRTETQRQRAIDVARTRERRESYVKGLETALRNLRSAHEARVREITAGKVLGKSFQLRSAGIVEVTGHG
jgi:hypothetical protein